MDANDQSKQGPESEIGIETNVGPESKVTDGGGTSINIPGNNVGTDVISQGEGGSDDKSDEPTVLPSNPPLSGKALMYQQYLESKQKQEEEKKKRKKETKEKRQIKTKIKKNYFLPQRTGLENYHLESPPNVSTMMFHHIYAPLTSK